jgi:hypothetical protein
MNIRCYNCKWWVGTHEEDQITNYGDCRASAPQLSSMQTVWPRTDSLDWCACWTERNSDWVPIAQPTVAVITAMLRAYEDAVGNLKKDSET